jgi:hypothetical protein
MYICVSDSDPPYQLYVFGDIDDNLIDMCVFFRREWFQEVGMSMAVACLTRCEGSGRQVSADTWFNDLEECSMGR